MQPIHKITKHFRSGDLIKRIQPQSAIYSQTSLFAYICYTMATIKFMHIYSFQIKVDFKLLIEYKS